VSPELIGKTNKIYCSDLLRAKKTAEPLSRYMGILTEFCEKPREINYGEAVGKSKQWAKENKIYSR
jgi:broad specificity phosphatase PhoE